MQYISIKKEEWDKTLEQLLLSYIIYAAVGNDFGQDYELLGPADIPRILYNKPKPATPLKSLFLPVKENVTSERVPERPRIILGIPNCDIESLGILDEIYLEEKYNDTLYRERRENTILIGSDCFGIQEHCHCTAYNIKPYPTKTADLSVVNLNGTIILRIISGKGESLVKELTFSHDINDQSIISAIEKEHASTEALLKESNKDLPDYKKTGELVNGANEQIWKKYSAHCVSCGACTTICPTCTCFLLIEKPGFEKVKQLDACQYPGFERLAGGEDALFELHKRFRNRYMCKYVWKPEKFASVACTGCGRCIEACIGKINKNELFMELV